MTVSRWSLPIAERVKTPENDEVFRVTGNLRSTRVKMMAQQGTTGGPERYRRSNIGRVSNALRLVAAIHAPAVTERDTCWECGLEWPCPTISAVYAILTSDDGVAAPDGTDPAGRGSAPGAFRLDPRPGDI